MTHPAAAPIQRMDVTQFCSKRTCPVFWSIRQVPVELVAPMTDLLTGYFPYEDDAESVSSQPAAVLADFEGAAGVPRNPKVKQG